MDVPGELTTGGVGEAVTARLRLGGLLERVAALGLAGVLEAGEVPLLLLARPAELHQLRRVGQRPVEVDPDHLPGIGQPPHGRNDQGPPSPAPCAPPPPPQPPHPPHPPPPT